MTFLWHVSEHHQFGFFLIPTTSVCKVLAERLGREGIVRAESTAAYWVFDFELCEVLEVAQHCLLYSI